LCGKSIKQFGDWQGLAWLGALAAQYAVFELGPKRRVYFEEERL
jgi:hypothetical protein